MCPHRCEEDPLLIAELSRVTGVPVPTVKFYLREGLLAPGRLVSRTRAHYDDTHVHRLLLIRALLKVGGLSLSAVRDVLAAVDGQDPASARRPRAGRDGTPPAAAGAPASRSADALVAAARRQGWHVSPRSAEFTAAVGVLDTLRELGHGDFADRLDDYAEAAGRAARADLKALHQSGDEAAVRERIAVGDVLGERLLAALRTLALSCSRERWGTRCSRTCRGCAPSSR
ncbi:MerR family transcriptional regulator [Streptomyces sp. NPDC017202]|uniref:MerR family transcriptional regulator n=1 Tax=Streptomyces sp. NPDC017202 TaxID=3364981 RepID=UPI0037B40351